VSVMHMQTSVYELKGREPEWPNSKPSTGNCLNCLKYNKKICIQCEHMAKILKFGSFQQLLKHILRAFSSLGGTNLTFVG